MARPRYGEQPQSVEPLARPITFPFSQKTAKNRFEKAAMTERMSSWDVKNPSEAGIPSTDLISLYNRWGSEGEIGLITTGSMSVDRNYMESPGNSVIPLNAPRSGERFERFNLLAAAIKQNGSLAVGQINLQGRQTQVGINPDPVSASDIELGDNELHQKYNKPHPASEEEITHIVESFSHAAEYLQNAGWDGVQVNAAHGYIFNQFLSRNTNKRTDQWGGSFENRARLLLDTVRAIRKRCSPSLLLSVKLNAVEFEEDGISLDEVKQVAKLLEDNQVDMIELSGGTYKQWGWKYVRDSTVKREGFFIEEAEAIKPVLSKTKLYATGGWKSASAMVDGLKTLDGIGMARPLAQDPTLCRDILEQRVAGATKQALDQAQYGPTALLAGTQLRAMSKGGEPADGSKPETSAALFQGMGAFFAKKQKEAFGTSYGHMELLAVAAAQQEMN